MIGTKLAHYVITSHLGSGGMGDVYQATDTKLGRDVAIKLLPEAFTHDTDRTARFDREARVLASLNHPNIAAIYGIEQSGERKFLVMELVGGETLAERIKRGPIPVDESLEIAKQIGEALESAHEKGIIHRDLKPANVKITADGKVKVLDFGLAKAFEAQESQANLSQSPTMMSMAATNAGVILGTAAYMSPEQASGKTVDKRSDLWAFGVVLLEMLTGRPVFESDRVSNLLAAVLTKGSDWSVLPAKTPVLIRRLLRRCLEKDRKRRMESAADARLEIEEALTAPAVEAASGPRPTSSSIAWIIGTAALLIAAGLGFIHFRQAPPAVPPEMRVDIVTPTTSDPISFALSPDGRQIVFVASGEGVSRLWLRSLDKSTAQPLAGTEGAIYSFWSPDSRSIAFFAGSKLKRLDIGHGSPQTLTDATPRGGTWSPDSIILFEPSLGSPLFRIPASGGAAVVVTKLEMQTAHKYSKFLPGGRQFLFYAQGTPETGGIYLGSIDAPEVKRLTVADAAGVYDPDGWLLFIRAGTLMAQRLDLARRELTGDLVTVADPVGFDATTNAGAVSISATGLVAYRASGANRRQLTWFDRAGKTLGVIGAPDDSLRNPRISPDGRRVAVYRTVQGNTDVWLQDADRTTRFTFDPDFDFAPIWSPDGSRVVFASSRKGVMNLYAKPSSGAGNEELLVESAQTKGAGDWSLDGRFLIYVSADPQTGFDIWVLPLEGDRKPWLFLKTNFDELLPRFSPDGHWVAYQSNESGRYETYVRAFPRPGGQWQVSTMGGIEPRWAPSGKELYYIAPDRTLMVVPIAVNSAGIEPGTPRALFHPRIFGGGTEGRMGWEYDVSGDGRFLINTVVEDTATPPITLIQNWKPPAK
jgi:serine/threonine protein kinase